jgi:hypothetical protein
MCVTLATAKSKYCFRSIPTLFLPFVCPVKPGSLKLPGWFPQRPTHFTVALASGLRPHMQPTMPTQEKLKQVKSNTTSTSFVTRDLSFIDFCKDRAVGEDGRIG